VWFDPPFGRKKPAYHGTEPHFAEAESGPVERSELALFSLNYKEWLEQADNLTIERHDEECASVFHKAIADQGFTVFRLRRANRLSTASNRAAFGCTRKHINFPFLKHSHDCAHLASTSIGQGRCNSEREPRHNGER
jgi:hypothetical protein